MQLLPWQYQTPNGFTLRGHYTPPSGKPVLHFLHGNGFCSQSYLPMLQQLGQDYDLFLSDTQGHGDSDHGGLFVGWNKSAELAAQAWLAHRKLYGDVAVYGIGHSFGGVQTALLHSSNSPFDKTVLLDPVLFTPAMLAMMQTLGAVGIYHKNPLAKAALRRREHWPDRDTAIRYLTGRGMFKNWHPSALTAYIDHALKPTIHGLSLKCLPQREAEVFSSYPEQLWKTLRNTSKPCYVLYGNHSYPFVAKAASKWQKHNHTINILEVNGGHCFMQETPDIAASLIKRCLSDSD